jgi:hypothetical protein
MALIEFGLGTMGKNVVRVLIAKVEFSSHSVSVFGPEQRTCHRKRSMNASFCLV